jgi:hypothetical protein
MMRINRVLSKDERRRGVALALVSFLIAGLAVMSLALCATVSSTKKQEKGSHDIANALYVTEAGLGEAMMQLRQGNPANLGSEDARLDFGSAEYWVEDNDLGGGLHSLIATGVENGVGSRLELVVREVPQSFYVWAAFGEERMTMSSNAFVDSYNSDDGAYRDQDNNGSGSNSWANADGNIGSNGNIFMDTNSAVHGNASPGPGKSAWIQGNATVSGSTLPSVDLVDMPPIEVPNIPSSGDHTVSGDAAESIVSGEYHFDTYVLDSNSTLYVEGPAILVFETFEISSNAEMEIDATGGPVEIYVIGDFIMDSNTLITSTTNTPADVEINLLSDNILDPQEEVDLDDVDFDSNAQLYGTIYAPNAMVEINSNFELFGALMARRVHLDSNAKVHFDEALMNVSNDEESVLETVAWRKVPYQP